MNLDPSKEIKIASIAKVRESESEFASEDAKETEEKEE
jgi:hypothetical protein